MKKIKYFQTYLKYNNPELGCKLLEGRDHFFHSGHSNIPFASWLYLSSAIFGTVQVIVRDK